MFNYRKIPVYLFFATALMLAAGASAKAAAPTPDDEARVQDGRVRDAPHSVSSQNQGIAARGSFRPKPIRKLSVASR
jgi:hypothetical protein